MRVHLADRPARQRIHTNEKHMQMFSDEKRYEV